MILFLMACSIEDPSGTSWDTSFFLTSAPETLRVSQAGRNDYVDFTGDDSLIIFRQELEDVRFGLGDSLFWSGTRGVRDVGVDTLRLGELGSGLLHVSLAHAFPDLVPLIGSTTQISQRLPFLVEQDMPPFLVYQWISFLRGQATLSAHHDWPFTLEPLQVEILNADGGSLFVGDLQHLGVFTPDEELSREIELEGLATQTLHVRIAGRNLPMTAAAPILDNELQLELAQHGGAADSALALLPVQRFSLHDEVFTDSTLLIDEAICQDQQLELWVQNGLSVPMELELSFPEIQQLDLQDTLRLASGLLEPGELRVIQLSDQPLRITPDPQTAPYSLQVHVEGVTQEAGNDFQLLRSRDRASLDIRLSPARLDYFRGQFSVAHHVPVENSRHLVEEFPSELHDLVLRNLALHLQMANPLRLRVEMDLDMGVISSAGYPDSTFHLQGLVDASREQVILPGMGSFVERIPRELVFNGGLFIPAGESVALRQDSEIRLTRLDVPGRLRVVDASWRSDAEFSEADLASEVVRADVLLAIESTVPLGGSLNTWLVSGEGVPGDTTGAIRAFEPVRLQGAGWSGDSSLTTLETIQVRFSEEALDVLRGGHWENQVFIPDPRAAQGWWGWYDFHADSGQDTVSVRRDQEIRVQARIQVQTRLGGS
ncbi:MAG: hypothetical protein KDC10_09465 [Calditrichaeota bacterium]|nr:hypothetical protein [Calditrichota bacterium]